MRNVWRNAESVRGMDGWVSEGSSQYKSREQAGGR